MILHISYTILMFSIYTQLLFIKKYHTNQKIQCKQQSQKVALYK